MTEVTNAELADALLSLAVESRNSDAIILRLAAARLREVPSMSDSAGWIEWDGGECPVVGREVEYVCAGHDRILRTSYPQLLYWGVRDAPGDIVRYRLSV